jgi:hypothetical protein
MLFVLVTDEERQVISQLLENVPVEALVLYQGRMGNYGDEGLFYKLRFNYGGEMRPYERQVSANVKICGEECVGGINLDLQGSTEDDGYAINGIRSSCFFGCNKGLIFLGAAEFEGEIALSCAIRKCNVCQKYMSIPDECGTGTCNACADICEHEYEEMPIIDRSSLVMRQSCKKCLRCRTLTEEEVLADQARSQEDKQREVSKKTGIGFINENLVGDISTVCEKSFDNCPSCMLKGKCERYAQSFINPN